MPVLAAVPASLVVTAVVVSWLGWLVATIASKFGGIPSGLPGFHFPPVSLELIRQPMAPAFTIASLGGIESLLSATVADGMADTRHDSKQELIGQGIANLCTPLIGGFTVTGAIARTRQISAAAHARLLRESFTRWCCWCSSS